MKRVTRYNTKRRAGLPSAPRRATHDRDGNGAAYAVFRAERRAIMAETDRIVQEAMKRVPVRTRSVDGNPAACVIEYRMGSRTEVRYYAAGIN